MDTIAIDYVQQAITLMQNEKYGKAISFCDKALELEPTYKEAYTVKADAYVNLEEYENALEIYNKVLLLDPEDGETYFSIGNLYVLMDDMVKCIEFYNKSVEKNFQYYGLYKNLADIYRQLNQNELVLKNYNRAIQSNPLMWELRLEKAGFQILLGQFVPALETLDDLQKLEPDLLDTYTLKADIYCGIGQYADAMRLVDQAIKQHPEDATFAALKVKVLIQSGKDEEAMEWVKKAKSYSNFEDASRDIYLMEAQLYAADNDLQKASQCLENIRKQNAFDVEVNYLLLSIYYSLKKMDRVGEIADTLSSIEEDNVFSVTGKYYKILQMKEEKGIETSNKEFHKLAKYLQKATIRNPHFYEGYLYRLLCHKELKEYDKALEIADYIEALDDKSSDAYLMRYTIYKDMGDLVKAEEMKQVVNRMNPNLIKD